MNTPVPTEMALMNVAAEMATRCILTTQGHVTDAVVFQGEMDVGV